MSTVCEMLRKSKLSIPCISGLEIKNLQVTFGDQLEKYSHQMQIFSHQFV